MIEVAEMKEMTSISHKDAVYLAAIKYIEQGMHVVPLRVNSKLMPETKYNVNYGSASKKRQIIDKWFNPQDGKFAGWNIGIACGKAGGVFAVDIDMHGDTDGLANWNELIEEFGDIDTPMQKTPSGGYHKIFRWQDNAVSSTGKIAKGIDTRGGEEKKCKSHIVAFPSKINGRSYKWVQGGEIPHIPQWVMDKMGVAWRTTSSDIIPRGSEEVDADDIESQIPLEQVQRMLGFIDPNDLNYDDWLRIGQAINSQHPNDEGLVSWDEWSSRGDRYEPNECVIRWNGFAPGGPVRMGTLFHFSMEGGWEHTSEDASTSKYEILVAEINRKFAVVLVGNKIRIVYEKEFVLEDFMSHYELLSKDDFGLLLSNRTMMALDARGNNRKIPVSEIWLASSSRRTYVNGIGLFPEGDKQGFYNTWRGFAIPSQEGNCELMLDHIHKIICSGIDDWYDWLMDWMADLVQDPSNPKGCAVIMRGTEGTGKGLLGNLMCSIFGFHARHLIDDSHLTGNFNAHMIDALVVFADEITWGGNKKSAGKLKGMVTERYLLAERKGVDVTPYRNMIHMMIASNEDWVIPAGPQSRRWFVLDVSNEQAGNKQYFDDIGNEMDNGGREAFLYHLLNREITSNLTRAPETDALDDQRARQSQNDPLVVWWANVLESGVAPTILNDDDDYWPEFVDRMAVYREYEMWCLERKHKPVISTLFYQKMTSYGLGLSRKGGASVGKKGGAYKFELPDLDDAKMRFREETSIHIEGS